MIESADRTRLRVLLGAVGALVLVGALVTAGGLAAGVVSALRAAVDNVYLLVMALGAAAVALGTVVLLSSRASVRVRDLPEVERPTPAPVPGEALEARLGSWRTSLPVVGRSARAAVRERLRAAAVWTVAAERGITEDAAETVVADGSWTDDAVAAAFLSSDPHAVALTDWLRALAHADPPFRYRARRTIAAIRGSHERSRGRT